MELLELNFISSQDLLNHSQMKPCVETEGIVDNLVHHEAQSVNFSDSPVPKIAKILN